MRRRHTPGCALALSLLLLGLARPAAGAPPNIVLIISDDHGWTDYGFMGHPHIQTPNLDRLASQSLLFPRGYVSNPLCCPSLASIITGKFAHQHGVVCNDPPSGARDPEGRERLCKMIEAQPTLPRLLGQHGYLSYQAGKWWLGDSSRGGFGAGMSHGDLSRGGRHGDVGLEIGRKTMQPVFDFIHSARTQGRPFFLWYAPMMPHAPHNPPKRLLDQYRARTDALPIAKYWAMVEWFDQTCGQLLDQLDREGLADNTLVLFIADNGVAYTSEGREVRSKREPYEKGVRTPVMVRFPGHMKPSRIDTPVSSLDLYATALAASGIDKPAGAPGIDLLDAKAVEMRGPVFGSAFEHTAITLDNPAANLMSRYIIDGRWKLIAHFNHAEMKNARVELFDLGDDPDERRDLSNRQPRRVGDLMAKLDGWWRPDAGR